ncbi:hypothetical protein SLEP1_g24257 [Rubroshorea leprosula]|uniref:Uncharacterized protein n=1 Tax=Rubroshorea leprosula TaxID=152421 RepID=A0AAV5JQH7_9ROSI|nr:hypothetical protein SLEP1_g24257 [Rubroshorea leprosula]
MMWFYRMVAESDVAASWRGRQKRIEWGEKREVGSSTVIRSGYHVKGKS